MNTGKKLIFLTFVFIASIVGASVLTNTPAYALSGSEFRADRIIDDAIFYNGNTLTADQIQTFLNSKVPSCDTNGQQSQTYRYNSTTGRVNFSGSNTEPADPWTTTTRAIYGQRYDAWHGVDNARAPYTCLKDHRQDHGAKSDSGLCAPISAKTNRTAAQIIDDVARACNISQKVLLVTLQKEQSLITDDWPWKVQYQKAMGYYCPDDPNNPGWCHPDYAGFFNQVYHAARQFNRYKLFPEDWNHAIGRTSFVAYQANRSDCGGTNLTMQTAATAGLYNYTPYQPNAAALNDLYGSGDNVSGGAWCSAFGNRNFWRMYNDWFGSTLASNNFDWSLESQSIYTDDSKTVGASNSMVSGSRVYAVIRIRNKGNQTWSQNSTNTVRMGAIRPQERVSPFCDPTWPSCSRAASLQETSVEPGAIGTFEFWMKAPPAGGSYNEYFGPVVEGVQWMRDIGLFYTLHTQLPIYSWQMAGQYAYTDSTKTAVKNLATLMPGEKAYIGFKAKNVGNVTWSNSGPNPVTVGTLSPYERQSVFSPDSGWLSGTRPALMQEATVAPGQTGTFEYWLTAPNLPGVRHERFGLIANGLTWFNDTGLSFYTRISQPTYSWEFVGQAAYSDPNRTIITNMANMRPGDKVYVRFTAKNTGNVTWLNSGANPVMAGTANPLDRPSVFAPGSNWLSGSRAVLMKNPSIAPGETATFEFVMTAPNTLGEYHERFNLIANNLTWFNDTGLSFYAKVNP